MKQLLFILLIGLVSCKGSTNREREDATMTKDARAMSALLKQTHCVNMQLKYIGNKDSSDLYSDSVWYYKGIIDGIYDEEK